MSAAGNSPVRCTQNLTTNSNLPPITEQWGPWLATNEGCPLCLNDHKVFRTTIETIAQLFITELRFIFVLV